MALHGASWDHRLFLLVAVATHALLGYAVGALLGRPRWGALGGVLPDADLFFLHEWPFPLVHRGALHTPLFVGVAAAVVASTRSRSAGCALGAAALSHLLVDSLTATGLPWLYPLSAAQFGLGLGVHGATGTALLVALAAALLAAARRARE